MTMTHTVPTSTNPHPHIDLRLVAAQLPLTGHHVLVVDDDDAAREVLRAVLSADGAKVTTAESAAEALQHLSVALPDVMLVDLSMPVVDGFTFVEQLRLRTDEVSSRVPIAALTGYMSHEDRGRAFKAGVQAYLVKPVDPAELVDVVKSLARARRCELPTSAV
jgi:CheY-like chemotaxis protein